MSQSAAPAPDHSIEPVIAKSELKAASAAKRRAVCSCGQLAVEVTGDPLRVSVCHCLACQRRTGSAFGVQARFSSDRVAQLLEGKSTSYIRTGDSGSKITFRFCPSCGATVCYEVDKLPGFVIVPVGAFADPNFPSPTVAVYETRRHSWCSLSDLEMDRYE